VKFTKYLCTVSIAILLITTVTSCKPAEKKKAPVEEEPLLLLDEPTEDESAAEGADNSRCHVCHMNYAEEKLAILHAQVGIGCESCHGDSSPHCGDEDNITPPDKMYAKETVKPYCLTCHAADKLPAETHEKVLHRKFWQKKEYCTDCHGEHVLAYRTRTWDKKTGKLLVSDGVRMMEEKPLKDE